MVDQNFSWEETPVVDRDLLKEIKGGDLAILELMTTAFFCEGEEDLKAIQDSLSTKNFDLLQKKAHRLKGSSSTVGGAQLSHLCKTIENSVESDPSSKQTLTLVDLLSSTFSRLKEKLTNMNSG